MSVALANTDEVTLRKFLVYSAFLHGALALAIGVAAYVQYRGDQWNSVGGNQGNDVKVNLVPAAGIPMPKPDSFNDSHAVDPTKGLYKEEPKAPDVAEMPKDALDIPKFKEQNVIKPPVTPTKEFKDEPRTKKVPHPSKVFEDLRPTPNNAVDYGKGGSPKICPPGTAPLPARPPAASKCKARAAVTSPPVTAGTSKPCAAKSAATGISLKLIRPSATRDALNR